MSKVSENMTKWSRKSLNAHFKKRVNKDSACLKEVFGRPNITEDVYEKESMKVLSTAWIRYSCEKVNTGSTWSGGPSYYDPAHHFVDDRLLTTIVSLSTDSVLTCYHEHFGQPHRRSQRKIEQMVRYVEHLGNQRKGKMLRNFSVDLFKPPHDASDALRAELGRVNAIPENT